VNEDLGRVNAQARIARFVARPSDFGANCRCRHAVRRAMLDTMACAFGGLSEPVSSPARKVGRSMGGAGRARVWSSGEEMPLEGAAFVNAVEGHVLDFDDVTLPLRGHPSIAMLPALLAQAEARDLHMADVEVAFAVGFEVTCRLAQAMAAPHYKAGWHTTATLAALGGVAALARFIRLSEQETSHALGLAMTSLGGTRGNFGTMAKSVQSGQAARTALFATTLAEAGFDASGDVLDGKEGLVALYAGRSADLAAALEGIGEEQPCLLSVGLDVKKYPLCYATHRAIDGLLDLRGDHPALTLGNVTRAEINGSPQAFVPLIHSRPQDGLQAKFSMEYAVAAALEDGRVTLASFADEAVRRPVIQDAFEKILVTSDEEGSVTPRWTSIRLTLRDGSVLERTVAQLRGSAGTPLHEDQLIEKAEDCCQHSGVPIDGRAFALQVLEPGDQPVRGLLDRVLPRQ